MDTNNNRKKGIAHILAAAFFFALMSFFVKYSGDLPTMQKSFFRNFIAGLVALILVIKSGKGFAIKKGSLPYLLARSITGTTGLVCNFYALDHMNISDANMLNKLSPFFAIIASFFILKEKASKKEWCIVILAFIGALLVMKPSFSPEFLPALVGMLGGLGAGLAYTFVRLLGKRGVSASSIILFFSAFSCSVSLPFLILDYHPMTLGQSLFLLGAGMAATCGQIAITAAYRYAPAKEISVFDYSQIIYAALLGFFFLGELPDPHSVLGYGVILSAAVWRWKMGREK